MPDYEPSETAALRSARLRFPDFSTQARTPVRGSVRPFVYSEILADDPQIFRDDLGHS